MEVAVLGRGSATGAHLALSLALAAQRGNVPRTRGGDGLILRVHLQRDGGLDERCRSTTVEGSEVALHGAGAGGFLETHDHDDDGRWLKRCQLTLLLCSPALLEPTLAWFLANAPEQAALFCLVPGFGHVDGVEAALKDRVSNKTLLLLFGTPTYACGLHPERGCVQTSAGALLMARLERKDGKTGLVVFLQALEASGLRIVYRATKYRSNWLFGACIWQSFHAYAALLEPPAGQGNDKGAAQPLPLLSMYQLLGADMRHRLVFARLVKEARAVCPPGQADYMDSAGSPLGLGFRSVLWLLRFPWPVFAPVLNAVMLLTSLETPGAFAGTPFGDAPARGSPAARAAAPRSASDALGHANAINGYLVAQGRRVEVATPINTLLLDKTRLKKRGFSPKEVETCVGAETPLNVVVAALLVLLVLSFFLVGVPYFVVRSANAAMPIERKFL